MTIEAIIKPPNKFKTIAVTTYLGSTIVKYAPIIDAETVDIAEAVKVYIRCLGIKGSCFLIDINTSDCPKIAEATALYDSSLPMPLILEITNPKYLIISGKTLIYCKIPISAETNTIGISTLRKYTETGLFVFGSIFATPSKTKLIPSIALSMI